MGRLDDNRRNQADPKARLSCRGHRKTGRHRRSPPRQHQASLLPMILTFTAFGVHIELWLAVRR